MSVQYLLVSLGLVSSSVYMYYQISEMAEPTVILWHIVIKLLPGVYAGFIVKVDPTTTNTNTGPSQFLDFQDYLSDTCHLKFKR